MNQKNAFKRDLEKSFELERIFDELRKEANPRFLFRIRLRSKLMFSEFSRNVSSLFSYSLTPKPMVTQKIISGLLGLAVLFGGGVSAYAYSSDAVTNGHTLYGLKLAIEKIEGNTKFSEESKALFHLKLAERRLAESERFALEGKMDSETEARMEAEMKASKKEAESSSQEVRTEVFSEMKSRLEARVSGLESLLADVEDNGEIDESFEFAAGGSMGISQSLEHANVKANLQEKVEDRLEKRIDALKRLLANVQARLDDVSSETAISAEASEQEEAQAVVSTEDDEDEEEEEVAEKDDDDEDDDEEDEKIAEEKTEENVAAGAEAGISSYASAMEKEDTDEANVPELTNMNVNVEEKNVEIDSSGSESDSVNSTSNL